MSHDHNNTRILPAHAWWGVNRKADPCRFSPSLLHKHLLSWGKRLHVVLLLQLFLCMPNPHHSPRSSQTAALLLFHSLQLQYVHKPQFTQHCVGPGMSALTRHNRNNVYFCTKRISHATRFLFYFKGGWDLDKRPSVRVSVAPAGSFYYADWLMYSDQPESTVLPGKGLNWW